MESRRIWWSVPPTFASKKNVRWCCAFAKRRSTRFISATCIGPPTRARPSSRSFPPTTSFRRRSIKWPMSLPAACLRTSGYRSQTPTAGKAEEIRFETLNPQPCLLDTLLGENFSLGVRKCGQQISDGHVQQCTPRPQDDIFEYRVFLSFVG